GAGCAGPEASNCAGGNKGALQGIGETPASGRQRRRQKGRRAAQGGEPGLFDPETSSTGRQGLTPIPSGPTNGINCWKQDRWLQKALLSPAASCPIHLTSPFRYARLSASIRTCKCRPSAKRASTWPTSTKPTASTMTPRSRFSPGLPTTVG